MIRSISHIGSLWPRCACGHIAQQHGPTGKCDAFKSGQCPTCGSWTKSAPCPCPKYTGPTQQEFKEKFLTPEEIEYYHWNDK